MPWLRSMEILNDIHTVFTEEDFDLKSYEARAENNLDKWQICINVNGTVTVVAQCERACAPCVLYMTFEGNGQIELWDGRHRDYFVIDRNNYTSKEICEQFHEKIAKTHKDAFEDGGYQILPFIYSGKLSTNKIIPQLYSIFDEWKLISTAPIDFISEDVPPQFECGVDGKGRLVLSAWTEIREQRPRLTSEPQWGGKRICITFDGSDYVTITKSAYTDDDQRVPIHQVKNFLWDTYRM